MFIYKITNTTNGDFYVGKTTQSMTKRLADHKYNTKYDKVKDTHLCRAMRKYGTDAFIIEALESNIPEEKLNEREIHWIAELNPHYNMTEGGDGVTGVRSEKWREANKKHHENRTPESYATYGMRGKKQSQKFHSAIQKSNSYPVSIDGVVYESIKKAQEGLGWTAKKVRYRIDSPNYPNCIRLRDKRDYPRLW